MVRTVRCCSAACLACGLVTSGLDEGCEYVGVLRVAGAVVEMIEALFPASLDSLPREQGFFAGPNPQLLLETALDDAVCVVAGTGSAAPRRVLFGAHQVFVFAPHRTESARCAC